MRTTSRSAVAAALLLVGVALAPSAGRGQAPAAAPTRSAEELRRLYQGAWHLTVPAAQARQTVDRAIARCTGEMNYFLQSVAAAQLREKTPVNQRLDIGFDDAGRITIAFDQRFTYTTRPGVAQDFRLDDGSDVAITQFFRDGHLEQVFRTTLGNRWNVYTLSPDGHTMTVAATQQGPMMPVPMHFTLDYRQHP